MASSEAVVAELDDVAFWSRQLAEHALFLKLGLADDGKNKANELRLEAAKLYGDWEAFRRTYDETAEVTGLEELLARQLSLQQQVLSKQNAGVWMGWLFPHFLEHINTELEFFASRLSETPPSAEETIHFWNEINGDHAGFMAQLLDPTETENIKTASSLRALFDELARDEEKVDYAQFLILSLAAGDSLDNFQAGVHDLGPQIRSVVHPLLMDHVIRENRRGLAELRRLEDDLTTEVVEEEST